MIMRFGATSGIKNWRNVSLILHKIELYRPVLCIYWFFILWFATKILLFWSLWVLEQFPEILNKSFVKSWNILTRFMFFCWLWFTTRITGNYEFWSKFQKKRYGKNVSLILRRVELYQSESCTCVVCDTSLQEYRVIMSSGANWRKKDIE